MARLRCLRAGALAALPARHERDREPCGGIVRSATAAAVSRRRRRWQLHEAAAALTGACCIHSRTKSLQMQRLRPDGDTYRHRIAFPIERRHSFVSQSHDCSGQYRQTAIASPIARRPRGRRLPLGYRPNQRCSLAPSAPVDHRRQHRINDGPRTRCRQSGASPVDGRDGRADREVEQQRVA